MNAGCPSRLITGTGHALLRVCDGQPVEAAKNSAPKINTIAALMLEGARCHKNPVVEAAQRVYFECMKNNLHGIKSDERSNYGHE